MGKTIAPMLVLGKAVDMGVSVKGGDFPLGALPMKMQRIVREANDCYGYPVDYLAGAMLVAVGLGIGNTHFARLKGKWDESAILFMALVGRPGACKSHPLNFAIRPFTELDGKATRAYIKAARTADEGAHGSTSCRPGMQAFSYLGRYSRSHAAYPLAESEGNIDVER